MGQESQDAAEAAREALDILSRPDDRELQEIVRLAADLCEADAAALTVLKEGAYHLCVTHGMEPTVCPADETFCQFTMTTEGTYFVHDALADERFTDLGWVAGRFGRVRFYASAPLYCPGGTMLGRLCVVSADPHTLSPLQERSLQALANSVTRILELRLTQRSRPAPASQDLAMMSHLAAELSHDMRVPLSSILASVEMLQDELTDTADPAVGMLLGRAGAAADRMSRMLEQIMHFGSIDDDPEMHDVDLNKLLSQLVLDSGGLLDAQGAQVEFDDLPVVRADADEMYSLFQNLIANSAKFARPGVPARISIRADRQGDLWRLSVSDNGIGIPEDRRTEVFGLFSRVDPAIDGHGIGLATAARIVAAHGGRIAAEAAPGGGTVIWFELPALPDERVAS